MTDFQDDLDFDGPPKETGMAMEGGKVVGNPYALTKPEVVSGVSRVEVDTRIATARTYPRDFSQFMNEALFEATYNAEVAEEMWYSRPVDDKGTEVEGPSIRLAEIMAKAYGNLDYGFDILGHDGKMLKTEAWCWDLEKNNRVKVTVTRRITTKTGRIFGDSMIQTTGMAAGSVGVRNAIFKIIPKVFVVEILRAAKKKYQQEAEKDLDDKITKALKWFDSNGVTGEVVLNMLGRDSVTEITAEDVVKLRGTMTAIRGQDLTVKELIQKYGAPGSHDEEEEKPGLIDKLREKEARK